MCGICGIVKYKDQSPVDPATIARMCRSIVHRGPDDEGSYFDNYVGLGFRRLAILDLSPAGHQPMSDSEGKLWLVFNGEIYNFLELRQELEALGHRFKSQCDTEVIIYGYKQWGADVLQRLNGMFGLALWDTTTKRLLVARDAMGIKPIYYAVRDDVLYFGSEIRAIQAALGEKAEVDPVALNLFLRYRYTPSPLTVFSGINKLAPGEMLIVENGAVHISRWYNYKPKVGSAPKPAEAREALLEVYKRAVKRHLISDVPVGLLLSGGIDSGLLLGLMSLFGKSWPTFTVGYGTSFKDDELKDAAETAAFYSAKNSPVLLDRPTFEAALPKIVDILEEPVASSSIVPMYFVSGRAREEVKVALIGQGPDELFGGYTRHLGVAYGEYWRKLPAAVRGPISAAASAMSSREEIKRAAYSLGIKDRLRRYQQVFSIESGAVVDDLFQDGILPPLAGDRVLDFWSPYSSAIEELDELGGFQLLEIRSSLPDELLIYADKLSMIHSLEARIPFLDREVVEFAQNLPSEYKVRRGSRKWLHRQVCREFLPPSIIGRKKRGFAVNVVDDWFRSSMQSGSESLLSDPKSLMYRWLRRDKAQKLLTSHKSGSADNHKILFSLVVFEQWLRAQASRA